HEMAMAQTESLGHGSFVVSPGGTPNWQGHTAPLKGIRIYRLSIVAAAEVLVSLMVDGRANKVDRPVAKQELRPAGMPGLKSLGNVPVINIAAPILRIAGKSRTDGVHVEIDRNDGRGHGIAPIVTGPAMVSVRGVAAAVGHDVLPQIPILAADALADEDRIPEAVHERDASDHEAVTGVDTN